MYKTLVSCQDSLLHWYHNQTNNNNNGIVYCKGLFTQHDSGTRQGQKTFCRAARSIYTARHARNVCGSFCRCILSEGWPESLIGQNIFCRATVFCRVVASCSVWITIRNIRASIFSVAVTQEFSQEKKYRESKSNKKYLAASLVCREGGGREGVYCREGWVQ